MVIRIILISFIEWLLFSQGFLFSSEAQDNIPQLVKKISLSFVSIKSFGAPSILIEDEEGKTEREAVIEPFILLLKSDINECKNETEKHPKQSFGYECLGEAYREQGLYNEAIDSYKKAIQIEPNAVLSYKGLGKTYRAMRLYQNAIDNLKKAVSINFEDSEAHFFLGLTFHEIRDNSSAYKEYKILQKLDLEEANKLLNFITNNHSI